MIFLYQKMRRRKNVELDTVVDHSMKIDDDETESLIQNNEEKLKSVVTYFSGLLLFRNTKYKGTINSKGEYHGHGVLYRDDSPNTKVYEGEWKNGEKKW